MKLLLVFHALYELAFVTLCSVVFALPHAGISIGHAESEGSEIAGVVARLVEGAEVLTWAVPTRI